MGKLRDYHAHLKKYTPSRQQKDLLKIVAKYSDEIIELNQKQLLEGEKSDGTKLKKYKSEQYARFKYLLNQNRVTDLRLHGNFYAGFFVRVEKFPVSVWSSDKKVYDLSARYGKNIFNLQQANINLLVDKFLAKDIKVYYKNEVYKL